jgi:hypothetical protein
MRAWWEASRPPILASATRSDVKGTTMSNSTPRPAFEVDTGALRGGLVLLCVGGVMWLIGAVVSATALGRATRNWIAHWEESPSEIARRRMEQLKVAMSAGSQAWRQQSQ